MKITFERPGSALVLECSLSGTTARGRQPVLRVANWRHTCGSASVRGVGLKKDGPDSRAARALCVGCGDAVGSIVIAGVPRGTLEVSE